MRTAAVPGWQPRSFGHYSKACRFNQTLLRKAGSIKLPAFHSLCIGLLFLATIASATDQREAPAPCLGALNLPGDEVAARLMSHNAERAQNLRHVDSIRHYSLDYTGFPNLSAHMQVKASYSAPGTKEFTVISESGSVLLRKQVLHRLLESEREAASNDANREAVALSTANYRFSLLGCDSGGARPLYVMRVEPLRDNKFLYRGTIWIDSQDFAVTRIEAEPARNPSYWTLHTQINHWYQKSGEFYLPVRNQTTTEMRFGGKALLTIEYLDYKLSEALK
jgi:hypothetical protein